MLSSEKFIKQSLEIHLFFARIMKEHAFFLEVSFTPKNSNYSFQADIFRKEFDALLAEVIILSNGIVSNDVLQSQEVITPYTLNAEMKSSNLTGVNIDTKLTKLEASLIGGTLTQSNAVLEQQVFKLNNEAETLLTELIQFKTNILTSVLACKMFTNNYPLLIEHIMREAKLYRHIVRLLQNRKDIDEEMSMLEQELFWNNIMGEHSKFIRGLLDPSEEDLFNTANNFGNEFDQLVNEAKQAMDNTAQGYDVTEDSLKATRELKEFKTAGTKGILECKIKSIIIPLLADHTLREANHYLRLLKTFQTNKRDGYDNFYY